jgi:hypothetical protein
VSFPLHRTPSTPAGSPLILSIIRQACRPAAAGDKAEEARFVCRKTCLFGALGSGAWPAPSRTLNS